ncbi:MAG TPA: hypothetical protein PLP42_15475 [Acidobacteriota bacterium]|nr:hypothetical protein [Acidobacteriota bacterium]
MKILIIYYSFTSSVERLAGSIQAFLSPSHQVSLATIRPERDRSYWHWLLLSFIPRSSVAIKAPAPDPTCFDRVCLGFPKWTFSCPPLNRYLSAFPKLSPDACFGLFMSFGGFDEERYLQGIARRVSRKGRLAATLAVKRRRIESPEAGLLVRRFCDSLIEAPSPAVELKLDRPRTIE